MQIKPQKTRNIPKSLDARADSPRRELLRIKKNLNAEIVTATGGSAVVMSLRGAMAAYAEVSVFFIGANWCSFVVNC